MNLFLYSPLILYLIRYFKAISYRIRFKNFSCGYSCSLINSSFGKNNYVGSESVVRNSVFGDYSYVSYRSEINNATVGKFSSIGHHVLIGLGIHSTNQFISTHPMFFMRNNMSRLKIVEKDQIEEKAQVFIGNDVWIGARVTILDGVSIGDGSIIGAGAVVTKSVKPYEVVGGVPAKKIKMRFSKKRINYLNKIKWWDWPINKIQKENEQYLINR